MLSINIIIFLVFALSGFNMVYTHVSCHLRTLTLRIVVSMLSTMREDEQLNTNTRKAIIIQKMTKIDSSQLLSVATEQNKLIDETRIVLLLLQSSMSIFFLIFFYSWAINHKPGSLRILIHSIFTDKLFVYQQKFKSIFLYISSAMLQKRS